MTDPGGHGLSRTVRLGTRPWRLRRYFVSGGGPAASGAGHRAAGDRILPDAPDHIVGLAHNGVRGNPCIFPRKFFPELMALEGDVGGNVVIRAHPEELLLYETSAAELRDVDTVEALAAVQEDRQI